MARFTPNNLVTLNQASPAFDVFGRAKAALPETVFDSKLTKDKAPLFWAEATVSGSGFTSIHLPNESAVVISTDGTTGRFVRQTRMRFNYQPGKAQEIFMTGVLDFEDEKQGEFSVCRRSIISGQVVDLVVEGDDELNGEKFPHAFGQTVKDLDFTKSHIFSHELEWLGVGVTRHGTVRSGQQHILHFFENDNIADAAYMQTPNLPLRYEIEVTATEVLKRIGYFDDNNGFYVQSRRPKGPTKLKCICGTVISNGGTQDTGLLRQASTSGSPLDVALAETVYAGIGIRLKPSHLDVTVKLVRQSVLALTNDNFEWIIVYSPVLSSPASWVDYPNSAVQVAVGVGQTVSNGEYLDGAWASANTGTVASLENSIRLGSDIDGTPDEMWLCVSSATNQADFHASLTWREQL